MIGEPFDITDVKAEKPCCHVLRQASWKSKAVSILIERS